MTCLRRDLPSAAFRSASINDVLSHVFLLRVVACRYQVMDFLGSAAFSRAVQALDVNAGQLVCLKIIKVGRSA